MYFMNVLNHLCLVLLVTIMTFSACKKNLPAESVLVEAQASYILLDSLAAADKIAVDTKENFFGIASQLEFQIQMSAKESCSSHEMCKSKYINFLKEDVVNFEPEERELMIEVMDSAMFLVNHAFPNLNFPQIELIKTKATHYGPGVYYTRDNAIILPYDQINVNNKVSLIAVMLHEISHIVSRYHVSFKDDMYGLIGFKKMDKKLVYPQEILNIILKNPDGLNDRYYIELMNEGKAIKAVPIIVSNKSEVSDLKPGFMSYIKFDLYEIKEGPNGYAIECDENGYSNMNSVYMKSFFDQIKDNTQYIIHPDEIIADNFLFLTSGIRNNDLDKFSEKGQLLLEKMRQKISTY